MAELRRLNCQLVRRHPTGYRLTELGDLMCSYAERVEDAVAAFERGVTAASKDLTGVIKVTCPEAVGARLMRSPLMNEFQARYPSLRVEFVMSDRVVDLAKGEADIAIRAKMPNDGSLFGRKVADCPWAIYASQSYLKQHGGVERAADIDGHSVVMFSGELRNHQSAQWLRSVAPNAHVAARGSSLTALVLAAASGAGLAPLPVIVGEHEPNLVRVLGPLYDIATPFYLLIHQDMRQTPRVRAFFDFMIQCLPMLRPLLGGDIGPANAKSVKVKSQSSQRRKA